MQASPWLSEHGNGKYAVNSRLEAVIGLAFVQVDAAVVFVSMLDS
jgi:hypothetical protein